MKRKKGRPGLSQETKNDIIYLRKAGKTYSFIARKFGIHPQTAYVVCKAAGALPVKATQSLQSELKQELKKQLDQDTDKRIIGTLKQTIERLVREVQANEERNADLVKQLDDLQEAFRKEKSRTWLDRLIGF